MNSSPNAKGQKPEPKEDVNFLIDDVDREHTESVLVFNCARRTIVVESAFGHLKLKKNIILILNSCYLFLTTVCRQI